MNDALKLNNGSKKLEAENHSTVSQNELIDKLGDISETWPYLKKHIKFGKSFEVTLILYLFSISFHLASPNLFISDF